MNFLAKKETSKDFVERWQHLETRTHVYQNYFFISKKPFLSSYILPKKKTSKMCCKQ